MKNLKQIALGLLVGAMAIGFSAFANANHKLLNTYYPVKTTGSNFSWQQINPNDYQCVSGAAACSSYQSATPPADNRIPSGYAKTNQVLQPL
ncbi:hypothetical protein [Mucilaginibacter sp. 10I4]|uniref:hypothetical protein n=1 Tax=Mucilaginibacter sp. 10I4 TaxID=3048580 RepID=UPI002B22BBAD|nr:hypothetical protein [Mucilaginibacter sp. 10I4]MEB0261821.1 hypothetical protein [Mucilaginibacter sp. 10I4]